MSWQDAKNRWKAAFGQEPKTLPLVPQHVREQLEPTLSYLARVGKYEIVLELVADHQKLYNDPWLNELDNTCRQALFERDETETETETETVIPAVTIESPTLRPRSILAAKPKPFSLDFDDDVATPIANDSEAFETLETDSPVEPIEEQATSSKQPLAEPLDEDEIDKVESTEFDLPDFDDIAFDETELFEEAEKPNQVWATDIDPDLDDFLSDDDLLDDEYSPDDDHTSKIPKEIKARQIAAEVISRHDWSLAALPLLTEIFTSSGYGQTRVALERLMSQGLTLQELILAAHIKALWMSYPAYWISFSQGGDGYDTQHLMSWPSALGILNAFTSLPSIEEVEVFLDEQFDYWSSHEALRLSFKSFRKYIWFRTSNLQATLCPTEWRNFS